jgi:6-phosphogluconolactonase
MTPGQFIGDQNACADRVVREFRTEHARAIAKRGRYSVAIPGGSVGAMVFPALAALDLDWTRVDVFWVDERAVPPTDDESNYALAESLWLKPAGVPRPCVHRMRADEPDLDAAAVAYGGELARVAGPSRRLDLVLLGVGPDGHVASLFPGHPALREADRPVVAVEDAPKLPSRRLTLTLPVLVAAARVVVAAFGESKAPALGEALTQEDSLLPVALVLRQAGRSLLVADHAAARLCSG